MEVSNVNVECSCYNAGVTIYSRPYPLCKLQILNVTRIVSKRILDFLSKLVKTSLHYLWILENRWLVGAFLVPTSLNVLVTESLIDNEFKAE